MKCLTWVCPTCGLQMIAVPPETDGGTGCFVCPILTKTGQDFTRHRITAMYFDAWGKHVRAEALEAVYNALEALQINPQTTGDIEYQTAVCACIEAVHALKEKP